MATFQTLQDPFNQTAASASSSASQRHDSLHGNPRTCQAGIPRCLSSLDGHRIIDVPYQP